MGMEVYWHALRTAMHHRLRQDKAWYVEEAGFQSFADLWDELVGAASPGYIPPENADGLEFMHVFCLANALRRPLIVFDGSSGAMDTGETACALLFFFLN